MHNVWLVVKNIGKLPAEDLNVTVNPELKTATGVKLAETIFSEPFAFFPPQKEFRSFINLSPDFLSEESPSEYEFTVSYKWKGSEKLNEAKYRINVSNYKKALFRDEKGIKDIVEGINNLIRAIKDFKNRK